LTQHYSLSLFNVDYDSGAPRTFFDLFLFVRAVTRGIIHGVENREELEVSQMSVKVTKLIRHTADDAFTSDSNAIPDESDDALKEVTLHVAQHCGVSHGLGEFVFMARRKLGDLTLQCAPRLEDWALLVNRLSEEGKAHCVLRS
jgi:hypothetical protein